MHAYTYRHACVCDKLYSKEMTIKIDGKTVGTTLTQGSTKGA
jgi:hypothetical protein